LKDLKTKPKTVLHAVEKMIAQLEAAENLDQSGTDCKKMEGQRKDENYYRIRLDMWRVGIEYIHPEVIVLRILSRGEVYRHSAALRFTDVFNCRLK
jgi:mRNA interferase RelE/StbE